MDKIKQIRSLLEESKNPLFFYDNDPDGLVSFLLLKRKFQKGTGVIIRLHGSDQEELYLSKIQEHNPDLVVFLDNPTLDQEIFDKIDVKKKVWIDHHEPVKVTGVVYYNPRVEIKKNKPTSYMAYQISEEDLWLAAVGVTADWNNALLKEIKKEYPELVEGVGSVLSKVKPDDVLFDTKLGELARGFSFMLKGKMRDVRHVIRLLEKIKDPYEILEEKTKEGKELWSKVERIKKQYDKFLNRALKVKSEGGVLLFRYNMEDISFTSDLANELIHKNPDKLIIIARESDEQIIMSLRSGEKGINIPKMLDEIFKEIHGSGGGHEHASGAVVHEDNYPKFMRKVREYVARR